MKNSFIFLVSKPPTSRSNAIQGRLTNENTLARNIVCQLFDFLNRIPSYEKKITRKLINFLYFVY